MKLSRTTDFMQDQAQSGSGSASNGMSIRTYQIGLVLSALCTLAAFGLVLAHSAPPAVLYAAVVVLALGQFAAQLVFFLHLGQRGNGLNQTMFAFAVILVCIVVGGSLWIMHNLNARMMPSPQEMTQQMMQDGGSF